MNSIYYYNSLLNIPPYDFSKAKWFDKFNSQKHIDNTQSVLNMYKEYLIINDQYILVLEGHSKSLGYYYTLSEMGPTEIRLKHLKQVQSDTELDYDTVLNIINSLYS